MPEISGMELLNELRVRNNHMPVIVITGFGDISIAVRAMKLGAYDFLTKPFHDQYFLDLIQAVLAKPTHYCYNCQERKTKNCLENLSERERQILEMVANGKMNKQISRELGIAISTVELHRSRMMKKVNAKTFSELIRLYYTFS
jgi:two-component system response regulator FixJ